MAEYSGYLFSYSSTLTVRYIEEAVGLLLHLIYHI